MEVGGSDVEELKIKIRSVLLSSKEGVEKSNFLTEYTQLTGEVINLKQLGYKTLGDFMASIPDTVAVGRGGESYTAVSTEITDHLEKLIQRQKPATYNNNNNNKPRETTSYPTKNDGAKQPVVVHHHKYGRSVGSHHHHHHHAVHRMAPPGRRFKKHVSAFSSSSSSSSRPPMYGQYSYNNPNNNKLKPPMGVSTRLPGRRTTPPVTTTTTPVNSLNDVKMKVLSILCQAADGLHVGVLQKKFRSQTGTNISFVEYGYNSIGDMMLGFMWNNFKCIHSGDFYFAVRSSSGPTNNAIIRHNNHNHDNNRLPARNSNGPMWRGSTSSNTNGPSSRFNNSKYRPMPFFDNRRNMMSRPPETNGVVVQNRRFLHHQHSNPRGLQRRNNIHRDKRQTANNRGKKAMSSIGDNNSRERFINNSFHHDTSYREPDSPTTTTTTTSSSHYHYQEPHHHRLSRSDTTRSELLSDASSSSEYSPTASGSFKKNLKSEANNNMRNRSYSTNSNNSVEAESNSSQPLEDIDYDDSPWDDQLLSLPSGEEPQIFKNTFDPISSGLRFKKGRGCGRGYGLSSYMGERLPGDPRPSERSVALQENWRSTEKVSFQQGNMPVENLIISIRNTSLSDNTDNKPTPLEVGCGLGRGRGRPRKTTDPQM